jgi:hypothetical protein
MFSRPSFIVQTLSCALARPSALYSKPHSTEGLVAAHLGRACRASPIGKAPYRPIFNPFIKIFVNRKYFFLAAEK